MTVQPTKEIDEAISKLEEKWKRDIAALRSELAAMKGDGVWRPKHGDDYHFVNYTGGILITVWEDDCDADKTCLAMGNCFRTREQAELHVRNLRTHQRLREMAGEWKPDLRDDEQQKWFIAWDISTSKPTADYINYWIVAGCVYFDSKEAAQAAIDAIGIEDLKAYLIGEG